MDKVERERRVDEILDSQAEPIIKVQRIVHLGFDEDEAETLVAQQQLGQAMPVYYERLSNYEDEE